MRTFLLTGALNGFLAVLLGAFGAHALKSRLDEQMLAVYQTGIQYHFGHALALLLVGLSFSVLPDSTALRTAGWLFLVGILLFSGSLYGLSISGIRWLGAITPLGGLCFLAGWLAYAYAILRAPPS